jgi:hypothetical protein
LRVLLRVHLRVHLRGSLRLYLRVLSLHKPRAPLGFILKFFLEFAQWASARSSPALEPRPEFCLVCNSNAQF